MVAVAIVASEQRYITVAYMIEGGEVGGGGVRSPVPPSSSSSSQFLGMIEYLVSIWH
jgi:hypothetical protein